MNVLLIDEGYIKANGLIDENVDNKFIKYAIMACQDQELQEILGTDLLEQIQQMVIDSQAVSPTPIPAAYQSLLDNFIVPYLLAQVLYNVIIPLHFKIRNKGIMTSTSEDAQAVDVPNLNLVQSNYLNRAQQKGERMRKYILDNATTYPLFLNGNREPWKIRPAITAFQTSFWLGNQRKPYRRNYTEISSLNDSDFYYYGGCCGR